MNHFRQNDNPYLPELYIEQFIPFKRELSLVGVRDLTGNILHYPVVETVHKNNICHVVFAPAEIEPHIQEAAVNLGRAAIASFEGAGVFAVEMYQTQDDEVLVNEIAPRVHNSAHWTDHGSQTSQFEQHLRAILGLPLGPVEMTTEAAVMVNLLGAYETNVSPKVVEDLTIPGVRYMRWYGKSLRAARKVGHITAVGENHSVALENAKKALNYLNSRYNDAFISVDVER